MMAEMDPQDRFRGCLLGGAAGDALGMPAEGYTALEIQSLFGRIDDMLPAPEGHFHAGFRAGQFTDDTEETLMLAESLIEHSGFSADEFSRKLIRWGSAWDSDERLSSGVGFATRSAVERMIAGIPWQESGMDIPTCGSAIRSAPIGLLYHADLGLVRGYADLQSLPTHSALPSRAGAVAVAVGVALGLMNLPRDMILEEAASRAGRLDPDLGQRLLWIRDLLALPPREALNRIGGSPLARETVVSAFYCFMRFEPEEGLIAAANGGGDTDSIASIAGNLFGASYGAGWMPERWLARLDQREEIERIARDLFHLSCSFGLH
jgi:ADP-ribosyl-[dinitrogen reductase] hydrolase